MKNVIMVNDIVPFANMKEGSFRYVEQVSDEGTGIRYGGVISSLVEFQSYYSSGGYRDLTVGDTLYYYQEYDTDMDFNSILPQTRRILIGIFTVEKCVREKFTYSVYAYDAIYKLNYDFSEYLSTFRNLFPMSFATFCSTVHNFCFTKFGITINSNTLNCQNVSGLVNIDQFYTQGISLRDVLSYIASFNLQYARCTPSGEIVYTSYSTTPRTGTTNWNLSDAYIIAPTDQVTYLDDDNQPLIPVFYKQNGLSAEDYHFAEVDDYQVFIQDGSIVYRASADPLSDILNPYRITENFVANAIDQTGTYYNTFWNRIKTTGYADLTSLVSTYDVTPFEVHLFPFRCPFNAGQIVPYIEDEKGTRYNSVIMKLELTDSGVVLSCSGPEYYYSDSSKNNTIGDTTLTLGVEIDGKVSKSGDTMTGALNLGVPLAIASGGTGVTSLNSLLTLLMGNVRFETFRLDSGLSKTFTFTGVARGILFIMSSVAAGREIAMYGVLSNGNTGVTRVTNATGLSFTTATNSLTINNSAGAYVYIAHMKYIM